MKKNDVLFAILLVAFISVTSACAVGNSYQYHYHHTWRGY